MSAPPILWHIEVSHYNEKVRWALDHKGIAHVRRAPMPGFLHPLVALAKTRRPTFPILELDGRTIADSTAIIAALEERQPDPPLYPADPDERRRALELEDWFDEEVAPHSRRLMFHEIGHDRDVAGAGMATLVRGRAAKRLARLGGGAIARTFARRYGGRADRMDLAREKVRAGVRRVEEEVGPSGYLVGDRFTVADLTAAAVLVHLARPPEFQYEIPPYPPAVEEFIASLSPSGLDWVRRIWRENRSASAAL
jgi:glutathione S-transferase